MYWSAGPKIMRSTARRKRQLKRKRRGGYARAFQIHASPVRFVLVFEIPHTHTIIVCLVEECETLYIS